MISIGVISRWDYYLQVGYGKSIRIYMVKLVRQLLSDMDFQFLLFVTTFQCL